MRTTTILAFIQADQLTRKIACGHSLVWLATARLGRVNPRWRVDFHSTAREQQNSLLEPSTDGPVAGPHTNYPYESYTSGIWRHTHVT